MSGDAWVYGLWREETLAVLDDAWARRADEELREWRAVRTWGEARAMSGRTEALSEPFDPEDHEDEPDAAPFALGDLGAVGDGDWPGMPAQRSLDLLPDDWHIGEEIETVFSGPYLLITPDQEDELVKAIAKSGRVARRDDSLINRLGVWPDGL